MDAMAGTTLEMRLECRQLEQRENPVSFAGEPFAFALASDQGGPPRVRLLNPQSGIEREFLAYDSAFTGGVRVAVGDVTGDGLRDIVTSPGVGGGPDVRVIDGSTGTQARAFFAYDPAFTGGVEVAVGDVNRDGFADIITGAGQGGGPHVKVFDGKTGQVIQEFFAYDLAFRGGVRIATADLDADGSADVIVGAGVGGGPHVRAWSSRTGQVVADFFAYDPAFRGGVFVGSARWQSPDRVSLLTGAGVGGGPHLRVWSPSGVLESEALVAPLSARNGLRVLGADLNHDGVDEILAEWEQNGIRESVALGTSLAGGVQRLSRWFGVGPARENAVLQDYRLPVPSETTPRRTLEGAIVSLDPESLTVTLRLGAGANLVLRYTTDTVLSVNGVPLRFPDLTLGTWLRVIIQQDRIKRGFAWPV
jgi:hypothetical protein